MVQLRNVDIEVPTFIYLLYLSILRACQKFAARNRESIARNEARNQSASGDDGDRYEIFRQSE